MMLPQPDAHCSAANEIFFPFQSTLSICARGRGGSGAAAAVGAPAPQSPATRRSTRRKRRCATRAAPHRTGRRASHGTQTVHVLLREVSEREGAGGGGLWDPKVRVPKIARPDVPDVNFVFSRDGHFGLGGGGGPGGGTPPVW